MTQQRSDNEIRADLTALLDELFPLVRDDEPNEADLSQGVEWWAQTCIWWAKNCRRAWADRDAERARAERAEADRDALRARIGEALRIADDGGSYRKVECMAAALAAGLSLQEEQEPAPHASGAWQRAEEFAGASTDAERIAVLTRGLPNAGEEQE